MTAIEHLVTSGTFSLDGETFDVDNNVWIIGDDSQVIVIDPAHDVDAIAEAVGSREVKAILLTHGHDDHEGVVRDFAHRVGNPPVYLNPDDYVLWDMTYDSYRPDGEISDGDTWNVAGIRLKALHTPGHSPGSTCFFVETGLPAPVSAGAGRAVGPVLFSGDTLFSGGPGPPDARTRASRRSSSRSAMSSSNCPRRPSCSPGTAIRPRSEPNVRRWRTGSSAGTDPAPCRLTHARFDGTACRQMRHGRGSRPLRRLRPASACSAADG